MRTTADRFEEWARRTGFADKAMERAVSGDYVHPHVHYAWEGFKAGSLDNGYRDGNKAATQELSDAGFDGTGVVGETRHLIRWAMDIQQRYLRFINGEGGHYCQICGKTLDGYEPPNPADQAR